ncbi:MAG TPA: hypothetical protein V6C84_08670 [Coleofasciculaceae cyanobacterium]|jgi:hypothetical protein
MGRSLLTLEQVAVQGVQVNHGMSFSRSISITHFVNQREITSNFHSFLFRYD